MKRGLNVSKRQKNIALAFVLMLALFILSACGRSSSTTLEPITAESEGFWDGIILYNFSRVIIWISEFFGNNYGLGIIIFTIIVKLLLIPVSMMQIKSTRKMSDLNPEIEAIKEKYDTTDKDELELYNEELAQLYEERDINPYASCLPLLIQTPILIALYQAISRTPSIAESDFLWVNLGQSDPYFILPILAAVLAFINSKLTTMNTPSQTGMGAMTYTMPIMIFLISFRLASALSLYFVVSNAFMIAQTLLLNNPFKQKREMEEKEAKEREAESKRKKAIRKAKKTGRSVKK